MVVVIHPVADEITNVLNEHVNNTHPATLALECVVGGQLAVRPWLVVEFAYGYFGPPSVGSTLAETFGAVLAGAQSIFGE